MNPQFSTYLKVILAATVIFLTAGCSLDGTIDFFAGASENPSSSQFKFDVSNLDTSQLSPVITVQAVTSPSEVKIEMFEGEQRNKILFTGVPDDAEIICPGMSDSLAIQRSDLNGERSFQLKTSFWASDASARAALQNLQFGCYYQTDAGKSDAISFRVSLKENIVFRASAPPYSGVEFIYGSISACCLSQDSRYVVFETDLPYDGSDNNMDNDVYLYDTVSKKTEYISKPFRSDVLNTEAAYAQDVSADGRYVVCRSSSPWLIEGQQPTTGEIYVYDRQEKKMTLVSAAPDGTPGNGWSGDARISDDGRYIVYDSDATNIVTGDTNSTSDVFVFDFMNKQNKRVSVTTAGSQMNSVMGWGHRKGAISGDGKVVFFVSRAGLEASDTNAEDDIYSHDLMTGETKIIPGTTFAHSLDVNSDGSYITFREYVSPLYQIFLLNTTTQAKLLLSQSPSAVPGDNDSDHPRISIDGRYVVFQTNATNLILNDTNNRSDIFLFDRITSSLQRISTKDSGSEVTRDSTNPSISADGSKVIFNTHASDMLDSEPNVAGSAFGVIHDMATGKKSRFGTPYLGTLDWNDESLEPSISHDGRYVTFTSASLLLKGNENQAYNTFRLDRATGSFDEVARGVGDTPIAQDTYNSSISGDGRYVAFSSHDTTLVSSDTNSHQDVFVKDLIGGTTERVSVSSSGTEGNGSSHTPKISADGRYVVFASAASNLVASDNNSSSDIFIHDRVLHTTEIVSVSSGGTLANNNCGNPTVSSDGQYVVFNSSASNLVASDTNSANDVFLRNTVNQTTIRVSVSTGGTQGNSYSWYPKISNDGQYIIFESAASNLVANDTDGKTNIFSYHRLTGTTSLISKTSAGQSAFGEDYDVSADGRFVVFRSNDALLHPAPLQNQGAFVHDILTGKTEPVIRTSAGVLVGISLEYVRISGNGRYITYGSYYPNLTPSGGAWMGEIFVNLNPLIE